MRHLEGAAGDGGGDGEGSCRSTLCRITVRFASAQAGELGAELLPNLVPWDTKGILYADEREPTRVVFYAARAPELAP